MCGRFFRDISWADYHTWLRLVAPDLPFDDAPFDERPEDDIRPTQEEPVFRLNGAGALEAARLRWGLVPNWWKGDLKSFRATTFNARAETVASAPTFRDAFRQRRCLVPASGWYEWGVSEGKKRKLKFTLPDRPRFMFAGLWESWTPKDAPPLLSFTILTQEAGPAMAPYHHRAPVVLEDGDWGSWLRPHEDAARLIGGASRFACHAEALETPVQTPPESAPPKQLSLF
jgi:putative SOS response-associated peptidase YedK